MGFYCPGFTLANRARAEFGVHGSMTMPAPDKGSKERGKSTAAFGAWLRRRSGVLLMVALFSGVINVLALTGSFYMLQVYDRVLTSHSVPTLVGLTVLMVVLYVAFGLLDYFRVRIMSRIGMAFDQAFSRNVFTVIQLAPLRTPGGNDGMQPIRDLDSIRGFLSGLGPTALFDIPWIPVYLAVVFALHPMLGLFALAGAVLLVALTLLTDLRSSEPLQRTSRSGSERAAIAESARRNAETIRALGMTRQLGERWQRLNDRYIDDQATAADTISGVGTLSKILRMLLQSGILGLGAYFVLLGEVTAGTIIAASITMSRAMAPIETAIAHWRSFVAARQSYRRLSSIIALAESDQAVRIELPPPRTSLSVANLYVTPPGADAPVIANVTFSLHTGDGLGIIGPTASGKSSLVRALVGIWPLAHPLSAIRLDGAALDQWTPERLGRHIGYLPQDVELIEGTVAENIARFDPAASDAEIIAAAQAAHCHDMIVGLRHGYQTPIGGSAGQSLSGGQRQRIALARALFRDPFLVVLDEPNSNLDTDGEMALSEAITGVRRRGGIVVLVAHKPAALAAVDTVLSLSRGSMLHFGPRDEVMRNVVQTPPHRRDNTAAEFQAQPQTLRPGVSAAVAPAQSRVTRPFPNTGQSADRTASLTSAISVQDLAGLVIVHETDPSGKTTR